MWIKRKEWEEINKRLMKVEREIAEMKCLSAELPDAGILTAGTIKCLFNPQLKKQ